MRRFRGRQQAVFLACLIHLVALPSAAQTLRIYHIDVDQGAATLFISPNGRTMLVDSGKNGHGPRLLAAMANAGVTQIDHLVITHYHEDHYGGADELVTEPNAVPIHHVHDRGDKSFLPPDKLQEDSFIDYETTLGRRAHHLMRGETIPLDPTLLITCVSSGSAVLGEEPIDYGAHENDMHCVASASRPRRYGNEPRQRWRPSGTS